MTRFLICLVVLFACNDSKSYKTEKNGSEELHIVKDDDKDMNKAIKNAIATYDSFLDKLITHDSSCTYFSVKMRFPYTGGGEHMWINYLFYENGKLFGVVNNEPMKANTVEFGDTVEVKRSEVSDWMYLKDSALVGGYTIREIYQRMDRKKRVEFENELGFRIE